MKIKLVRVTTAIAMGNNSLQQISVPQHADDMFLKDGILMVKKEDKIILIPSSNIAWMVAAPVEEKTVKATIKSKE